MIKKLFTLCALFLIASPINAFAHGDITQALPAADSKVVAAPTEVSIEFDGKLQTVGNTTVNSVTVSNDQGAIISQPTSTVDGSKISTKLISTDVTGLVSVHYRIVSEDGHPVEGDYSFTVGETPMLISAQIEESAESDAGISEEGGSNLLVTSVGAVLIIGLALLILRRRKK
jgi:methionine-rich copper-binding protein CopC